MPNHSFAKRLKQQRLKKNLSQSALAKKLEISESTYRDWEYGRQIRGEKVYVQLSKLLGISLTELITGTPCRIEEKLLKIESLISDIRTSL